MKHLIYLIDGTWVFAGKLKGEDKHSNIYHLNNLLDYEDDASNPQIVHYIRGIGATSGVRRYTSGGFGYAIRENIQDIYINICSNYEPGDKIYVFGFSRGAVVARAVCGMLDFGILDSNKITYLDDIWNCFVTSALMDQKIELSRSEFEKRKESLSAIIGRIKVEQPEVTFLGLFDTVLGGRGMTRRLQELNIVPGFVPKCVVSAFQIHAIDETRPFFEPQPFKSKNPRPFLTQTLEQIWLPGVHTDIGGGYSESGIAEISRMLMLDRLTALCSLKFDRAALNTLETRIFEDPNLSIHVNSEYSNNGYWMLRGIRQKRKIPPSFNFLHPVADKLKYVDIFYKGKKDRYRDLGLPNLPRSELFVSPKYRDKSIAILN